MSNLESQKTENFLDVWKKPQEIKKIFAPDLTDAEFKAFIGLGMSLKANPFTREIWAVKYNEKDPAQIFLGRDFSRRVAQEQSDYDGHIVNAIYENDGFSITNGIPEHKVESFKDRGKLIGAFCCLYKKDKRIPTFVTVKLEEYIQHKKDGSVTKFWKKMPETMIKKVAEAQCTRSAYQGVFGGTYDESEQFTQKFTDYDDVTLEESKKEVSKLIGQCKDSNLKKECVDLLTTLEAKKELSIEKLTEIKAKLNGSK